MNARIAASLSLFPLVYLIIFGFAVLSVAQGWVHINAPISETPFAAVHIAAAAITFFSVLFFSVHVLRNAQLSVSKKAAWVVAFWFLTVFSLPLYYFSAIRSKRNSALWTSS